MRLKHYFIEKIAHSSYLLAGRETGAVIDPCRDVDLYIDDARQLGVAITHVLETHLHADFLSGHMDLAKRTGARIYAPTAGACRFEHVGLAEGDRFNIEDLSVSVLETPGHTPEHICYVITDTARGAEPVGVFSGDTLFVGDVGRPDLFPDMARELAAKLYESLHAKLLKLPDFCEVYPAHGAGSLCGRAMSAKWRSTIGYERKYNRSLQFQDRAAFIGALTTNMPPAPDHFRRCSDINRGGPALLETLPVLRALKPLDFQAARERTNALVVDARSYDAFGSQHVPDAWNIDLGGNFPTFAGWVLPADRDILLVSNDHEDAVQSTIWARRVGLDRITGYLEGGMIAWAAAGLMTRHVRQLSAEELHDMVTGSNDFVLVDVRAPLEYVDNHIEGAVNIPAADLRTRHAELDPGAPTVLICSSGNRASLAASMLKQHGFQDVSNVAGGMTGYSKAGYARECRVCQNPHGSRYFSGFVPARSA